MRKIALGLLLALWTAPAFGQVPPPVAALPDAERRTSYTLPVPSTCACSVGFALYGDSTDVDAWIEVWVDGTRYPSTDPTFGWFINSATGSLATIPRPITNAVLHFNSTHTGTVQIVGARRPRRTSQFPENAGVSARNLNQVITDLTAQNREVWDKTNDVTGRVILAPPGDAMTILPNAATRAGKFITFDALGNPTVTSSNPGLGNVLGPLTSVVGNLAAWGNTDGTLLQDGGPLGGHPINSPVTGTYAVLPADSNSLIESGAAGGTLTSTLPNPASVAVGFTVGFARNGGNSHVINTTAANIALPLGPSGGGGYVTTMTLEAENEVIWLTLDASSNWRPSGGTAQPTVPFVYPHVTSVTGIAFGRKIPYLTENLQFRGAGVYPLSVISPMPLIVGKANSSIGSSTPGQIFSIRFQWAANDITPSYTAIGGDTTATIAAALCATITANATITDPITGLPVLCQSFAGSATFNLQYDAALSATGATPLTTTSTGTGTINLAAEANALDFTAIELGRSVGNRAARAGDALTVLDFTGQSTTGLRDTHYGNIGAFVDNPASGSQRGSFIISTAQNSGPAFARLKIGEGLVGYNAVPALSTGGDKGVGSLNFLSFWNNGALFEGLVISPTQLTGGQNNYAPTGNATASVWRLTSDQSRSITGISGGVGGRRLTLFNDGNFNINLLDQNASSTAANRFDFGRDVFLTPKQSVELWYDSSTSLWKAASLPAQTLTSVLSITGVISPTQITANQNDYAPTGASENAIWRINSDAARSITGIAAHRTGEVIVAMNVGSFPITFVNESASSAAANRFAIGSDLTLNPNGSATFHWDITSSRWRLIGTTQKKSPTVQLFTSGTDQTYTTAAGATWIEVEMIGGGGGGAGSGTADGTAAVAGGNTCWRASSTACTTPLYQATGGTPGARGAAGPAGGGVAGSLTCNDNQTGGSAGSGGGGTLLFGGTGGSGRYGGFGPGGSQQVGRPASANSGAGGGGAGTDATANGYGAGGSAAGWCAFIISSPAATYTYTVGAAGTAGGAGASGFAGGAGAAGKIKVTEHYH